MFYSLWKKDYLLGQIIGTVSGVGTCALWMMAIWFPFSGLTLSGASLIVAIVMIMIALFAVIASINAHGGVLLFLFLASFFPVGLYLLGLSGWYRWIGVFNLGFLLAGLAIKTGSHSSRNNE